MSAATEKACIPKGNRVRSIAVRPASRRRLVLQARVRTCLYLACRRDALNESFRSGRCRSFACFHGRPFHDAMDIKRESSARILSPALTVPI
jgi:hypothetical protein